MSKAKGEVVSAKIHAHLRDRLDRFRGLLKRNLRAVPGAPPTLEPTVSDAACALIDGALTEAGEPAFALRAFDDDPGPFTRALRLKVHEGPKDQAISFRAPPKVLHKLDGFVAYLGARSIVEVRVERAGALRTLIFEALSARGTPVFGTWPAQGEGAGVLESGELLPASALGAHSEAGQRAPRELAAEISADDLAELAAAEP